jgi:hypothetical protein
MAAAQEAGCCGFGPDPTRGRPGARQVSIAFLMSASITSRSLSPFQPRSMTSDMNGTLLGQRSSGSLIHRAAGGRWRPSARAAGAGPLGQPSRRVPRFIDGWWPPGAFRPRRLAWSRAHPFAPLCRVRFGSVLGPPSGRMLFGAGGGVVGGLVLPQFKAFPSPNGRRFDYLPRLIREVVLMRPADELMSGTGKIAFHPSPQDPLGDIPVRDIVAVTHGTWTDTMLPAKVVGRALNLPKYLGHTAAREDVRAYWLEHATPRARGERRRIRKAIRSY